jgi:hypothetical protein
MKYLEKRRETLDEGASRSVDYGRMKTSHIIVVSSAVAIALFVPAFARGGETAQGQAQRGGQGQAVPAAADAKVLARVRVRTGHANVHSGPNSGNEVLVLAPKGSVMPMIGRRGEWIQVQLSPELRKTGILMRWYKNETTGWMHDSMVEFLTPEAKPDAK